MTYNDYVDVNSASVEELIAVPGIGPSLARRIIDGRPYETLDDLVYVQGIGEESLDNLRPYLITESEILETVVNLTVDSPEYVDDDEEVEVAETEVYGPDEDAPVEPPLPEEKEETEAVPEPAQSLAESEDVIKAEVSRETPSESERVVMGMETEPVKEFSPEKESPKAGAVEKEKPASPKDEKKESRSDPPTREDDKKEWVTRSQLTWSVIATAVLSILLTIALTLGILAMVNGGLQYASLQEGLRMNNQIAQLNDRTASLSTDINGIRTRLDTLETVAGRVSELEMTTRNIQQDIETTRENINAIESSLVETQQLVTELQASTQKFQGFLDGLRDLLNGIEEPAETGK